MKKNTYLKEFEWLMVRSSERKVSARLRVAPFTPHISGPSCSSKIQIQKIILYSNLLIAILKMERCGH